MHASNERRDHLSALLGQSNTTQATFTVFETANARIELLTAEMAKLELAMKSSKFQTKTWEHVKKANEERVFQVGGGGRVGRAPLHI